MSFADGTTNYAVRQAPNAIPMHTTRRNAAQWVPRVAMPLQPAVMPVEGIGKSSLRLM